MLLQRMVNVVPLWLLVLAVVAVLEIFSVGLMLVCRSKVGSRRASLSDYVKEVRQTEWVTMALGILSKTTAHALAHLTQAIFDLHADQLKDHALFQQAIHLLATIEDNRNERLDSADGSVPPILWFVRVAGALITLGYPAFLEHRILLHRRS